MKRNRYVRLTGGTRSVNRDLEARTRALAGLNGYVTNLEAPTTEYVMGAYHQLWQIEKSFRMSKSDLRTARSTTTNENPSRPTSALCSLPWRSADWSNGERLEHRPVRPDLRRYHTIEIQAGTQTITAADPLPDDVQQALAQLRAAAAGH